MISLQASPVPHLQTVEEFDEFLEKYYIPLQPEIVVEIGSFYGATLWAWIQNSAKLKTIVSVDLPIGPDDHRYLEMLNSRKRWPTWTKHVKFADIQGDSTELSTLTKVYAHTSGKVDFLFIDGDHSYEGVKKDWMMYKGTVRPGGIVAFHDSVGYNSVKQLCYEIEAEGYPVDLINKPGGWGISVVKV